MVIQCGGKQEGSREVLIGEEVLRRIFMCPKGQREKLCLTRKGVKTSEGIVYSEDNLVTHM